jgi:hypothetical protein
MASAAWRTTVSLTPHPKLFQLFHPNGGVSAGLPSAARAGNGYGITEPKAKTADAASTAARRMPDGVGIIASFPIS